MAAPYQHLGSLLRRQREQRGWSRTDAAPRYRVSLSYLSLLEAGKRQPSLSTLKRIAAALNLAPSEVMWLVAEARDDRPAA